MRTLTDDYRKDDYASQLLPCCGHFFMADEKNDFVNIMGCPSGIDWTIVHTTTIKSNTFRTDEQEAAIEKRTYTKIVFDFANQAGEFLSSKFAEDNSDGRL